MANIYNYYIPNTRSYTSTADQDGSLSTTSGSSSAGTALAVTQTVGDIYQISESNMTSTEKAQATADRIGLAVADYYTAGLASVFYSWASKQWGGTIKKIKKFNAKYNPITKIVSKLFGSDKWKTEGNRLNKLLDNGINIPDSLLLPTKLQRGRSKEELVDKSVPLDFIGFTREGKWVNNVFADTRDISALQPEDIWGYAAFFEKFGNDWLNTFSGDKRWNIASKALELGLVSEHNGTIDIKWSPELEAYAASIESNQAKTTNQKI